MVFSTGSLRFLQTASASLCACLFLCTEPLEAAKVTDSTIKGIVLVKDKNDLLRGKELSETKSLRTDVFVPGGVFGLEQVLEPYLCNAKPTPERATEIAHAIRDYYIQKGYPFTMVLAPKQEFSNGVIQLIVVQSKLEAISVEGNKWNSDKRIQGYVKLQPGDVLDTTTLTSDLNFINLNPFRRADLVYSAGTEFGTTDLSVVMDERRPYRFYAGFDNTGIETTRRQRMFTGFNLANLLGLDSVLSFQFTTSYNFTNFKAYTGQFLLYLPWRHTLNVYGGYSTLEADLSLPESGNDGQSSQVSARYQIPFMYSPHFSHQIAFGGDYKNTNNSIQFSELFLSFTQPVNLTQLALGYEGTRIWTDYRLNFDCELFWSPGKWLSHQTDADYNALRPGAVNSYVYAKGAIDSFYKLPKDYTVSLLLRGQVASNNLLPSEQIGLGGYDTVRGYNERQLNYDMGLIANLELRSPLIRCFNRVKNKADALQFLAFMDYGVGKNHNLLPGEPLSQYLWSAGPGARYTLDPYISLRLDWGIKLHKKEIYGGGASMLHFSAVISY